MKKVTSLEVHDHHLELYRFAASVLGFKSVGALMREGTNAFICNELNCSTIAEAEVKAEQARASFRR